MFRKTISESLNLIDQLQQCLYASMSFSFFCIHLSQISRHVRLVAPIKKKTEQKEEEKHVMCHLSHVTFDMHCLAFFQNFVS